MWEQIRTNRNRSAVLIVSMAALLVGVGYAGGVALAGDGRAGVLIAAAVWLVLTLTAIWGGDGLLLAVARAKEIKRDEHPRLWNVIEEMKIASGLPAMPRVFIVDDSSPNAFATGRSPQVSAVAVTSGLLTRLNRDELQGVVAHEMAHIHNRDVRLMAIASVMMGAIVILADATLRSRFWGGGRRRSRADSGGGQAQLVVLVVALVLMVVAPLLAQLIYFAISRRREYLADASAARFTRYPEGLAAALEKIAAAPEPLKSATRATAPMYIVNPLRRGNRKASDLTRTHPPISERVRILRAMGGAAYADYEAAWRRVTGGSSVLPPSATKAAEAVPLREPTGTGANQPMAADHEAGAEAAGVADAATRAREVGDLIWKLNRYVFVDCACGARLKIPPGLVATTVACPGCGRNHATKTADSEPLGRSSI